MKRTILFLGLLLLSVWLGLWIHENSGKILIVLNNWTIEMPLWFGLVSIFLGYFLFLILLKVLSWIMGLKQCLLHLKNQWKMRYIRLNTRRGLIEFGEGNWQQAEHHLIKALPGKITVENNDALLLNYLAAARAAQELGASERRDGYLREAQKAMPDAKIAIELMQAQLQIVNEQWEQALATLNHLHSLSPYHPYVMKLLVKVYLSLKDWSNLEQWLPKIRRKKVMSEKNFFRLENEVYSGLLEQRSKHVSFDTLQSIWNSFPKYIRKKSEIIARYVIKLLDYEAFNVAESECREGLKNEWHNALIALYGQCESSNIEEQLRFAEHFLKYYPNNAYLFLTLGRICKRCQLWGKAKSYFLKSVQIQPEAETYAELAKLSEELNEKDVVNEYYKKSLALALAKDHSSTRQDELVTYWDNLYCLVGKMVF